MSEISGYFLHEYFWEYILFLFLFLLRIEGVCGRRGEGNQSPSGREQF